MTNNQFFPETLKSMRNWCAWKLEQRKDNITKVPYQINGIRASSTDRDTWDSFDNVSEFLTNNNQYNGYGFMLADGIIFIDVDHTIDEKGTMDERGADILSAFPLSYAEISQSGHGLHILTRGTIQQGFNNRKDGVEAYAVGRFCAMTGNAIQALEPAEEQDGISYIISKYGTHSVKSARYRKVFENCEPCFRSDSWIIRHASNISGQRGKDFRTLFSGDISSYESASEADSALCTLLAFWCDSNTGQIDRIFRQSGLYRPKWEREDYRKRTIIHACEHIPESLSEWIKRCYEDSCKTASALQIIEFGKRDDTIE